MELTLMLLLLPGIALGNWTDWHFKGQNIALHRPVSQTPGIWNNQGADLAVDGYPLVGNPIGDDSRCSHTAGSRTSASWTVNFDNKYYLNGVVIVNRKSQYERLRLRKFRMYGDDNSLLYESNDNSRTCQGISPNEVCKDFLFVELTPTEGQMHARLTITVHASDNPVDLNSVYLTLCEVYIFSVSTKCPSLPITNGQQLPDTYASFSVSVQCYPGYYSTHEYAHCSNTGKWNTSIQCSPICHWEVENGYIEDYNNQTKLSFPVLTTVKVMCNPGYRLNSSSNRNECQHSGWRFELQSCIEVMCICPLLQNVSYITKHNNIVCRGKNSYIPINTVVYQECAEGFFMNDSQHIRTCQPNGSLSGNEPQCNQVVCVSSTEQVERVVKGIRFTVKGPIKYNENRNISINDSFFLHEGGDLIVSCAANGSLVWSSIGPPILRPVCPLMAPTYGWTNHACVTEKRCEVGKSVNITCKSGYTAAQVTATCLPDHTWSNKILCQEGSVSDSQFAVIGGAAGGAGAFLVVLLAVAGFILYRRRYKNSDKIKAKHYEESSSQNRNQQNPYSEIGATDSTIVSKGDSDYVYETNSTKAICLNNDIEETNANQVDKAYYSFEMQDRMPKTAIRIDHLYETVLSTSYSEEMRIQFKEFPKGLTEDHNEAVKNQNRTKNRYKNIYPYDATRVILQKDEKHYTDYINASIIHGYNQTGKFVAAQGPTKEIMVDFWRMVWQLRIGKIVMLTNLEEDKKMKCVQYWPDKGSIEYDKFKITHRSEELFSDFVIRRLALQKDGEEERIVYHFHFTTWPDKSVPKYASSLVHFRQKIVTAVVKEKGPDIVHCSAGVGRTGTFIALNVLTEQASTVGYVDPVGCVNTLRRQRLDMVQTLDQYIFLHMALLETLMLSTSALPASKFLRAYKELLSFDKDQRKLDVEFSRMEKMSPMADECQYVSAKEVRNRNKNRYSNILPVADHMPHLTPSGKRSEPDYINAVFLPNYKKKGAFIVTQTPLEMTKTDFWRLVVEHDVHTIVMMNNRSEMKEDEIYWPEKGESETYENMTIAKTVEECEGVLRKITLVLNRFGKTRKLQQIQFEGWPDDSALPSSPRDVLRLLDAVQYWQHQSGNNPVLVHCMNGADRSGLFCVVSAVLERMKIEQDVAITQVIKEMRNYREQIIPSVDQFQFVYEVIKEYILQNETYSNFND
ncbi:receptor-type tyrosine-protein phosphatase mu-like isoform X2 [Mya arenaria]|uniref:receptor-type tyrosine-protein phosphatase mu-like isoform X2 n=1 Tax=Mya arenaria TaxID=6604 RepID=UPI0022E0C959|nr:receptor-type tyrosine-protein phosphatase mu-like isoform X2 [Mya arenaria]